MTFTAFQQKVFIDTMQRKHASINDLSRTTGLSTATIGTLLKKPAPFEVQERTILSVNAFILNNERLLA